MTFINDVAFDDRKNKNLGVKINSLSLVTIKEPEWIRLTQVECKNISLQWVPVIIGLQSWRLRFPWRFFIQITMHLIWCLNDKNEGSKHWY